LLNRKTPSPPRVELTVVENGEEIMITKFNKVFLSFTFVINAMLIYGPVFFWRAPSSYSKPNLVKTKNTLGKMFFIVSSGNRDSAE